MARRRREQRLKPLAHATKETQARYFAWQEKVVLDWQPEKADKIDMAVAKLVAIALAIGGEQTGYGRRCYRSDGTIADQIGRRREAIGRYRRFLIDHGVFAETGERYHPRQGSPIMVLRIGDPQDVPRTAQAAPEKAGAQVIDIGQRRAAAAPAGYAHGPSGADPGAVDEFLERRAARKARAAEKAASAAERPRRMHLGDDD
jgi:hypothetical protein